MVHQLNKYVYIHRDLNSFDLCKDPFYCFLQIIQSFYFNITHFCKSFYTLELFYKVQSAWPAV